MNGCDDGGGLPRTLNDQWHFWKTRSLFKKQGRRWRECWDKKSLRHLCSPKRTIVLNSIVVTIAPKQISNLLPWHFEDHQLAWNSKRTILRNMPRLVKYSDEWTNVEMNDCSLVRYLTHHPALLLYSTHGCSQQLSREKEMSTEDPAVLQHGSANSGHDSGRVKWSNMTPVTKKAAAANRIGIGRPRWPDTSNELGHWRWWKDAWWIDPSSEWIG